MTDSEASHLKSALETPLNLQPLLYDQPDEDNAGNPHDSNGCHDIAMGSAKRTRPGRPPPPSEGQIATSF